MNKIISSFFVGLLLTNVSCVVIADAEDDKEIKRKVEHALDYSAASDDIKVQVKDNVVTLEGTTLTENSAKLAEATVRTAVKNDTGVTVINNLNSVHD